MKKLSCACDIGSVLVGDENWTFAIPNIGGDGRTKIRIYESNKEWAEGNWHNEMTFISSVQGRFGIYRYDCAYHELLRGEMTIDDAMIVLNGRYGVYNGYYKIAFVKWEDENGRHT